MTIPLIRYPEFRPYSNIQPFTVQDGATYALQIETLLAWIKRDLVPHIDAEIGALAANWDETGLGLITAWEEMSAALIARVDEAEAAMGNAVTESEAAKVAAEAARDLAAIYASQAEDIQDVAISTIISDPQSEARIALESLFASAAQLATITDQLEGRLSETGIKAGIITTIKERAEGSGIINVMDYGAVSDGSVSGGTDNSDAFENAYAATPVNGTLYVPPGKYYFSRTFKILKSIHFMCDWAGFGAAAAGVSALYFPPGINGIEIGGIGSAPHGWQFGPFQVISSAVSYGESINSEGVGISVLGGGKGVMNYPRVSGFGSHGFLFQGGAEYGGGGVNHATVFMATAYNNGGDGIRIQGTDAQKMLFVSPDVVANLGWGINISGAAANYILSPHADQQYYSSPGAYRDNAMSNRWEHVYAEGSVEARRFLFDVDSTFSYMSTTAYARANAEFANTVVRGRTMIVDSQNGNYGKLLIRGYQSYNFNIQMGGLANETFSMAMNDGVTNKLLLSASAPNADIEFYRSIRASAGQSYDLGTSWAQWNNLYLKGFAKLGSFATGSRPIASVAGSGAMIYDSTLKKPIWSDGGAWRDFTGTVV